MLTLLQAIINPQERDSCNVNATQTVVSICFGSN